MHAPTSRLIPIVGLLAFASACGPDLRFERDANIPIPPGATWTWSAPDDDGLALDDGAVSPSDSLAALIESAVEAELTTRGYRRVAADSAQFIVHFHLGHRSVTDTMPPTPRGTTPSGELRGTWRGAGQPEDFRDQTVTWEEGMLIVDLLPRDRRAVAWRGVIAGEIPREAERDPGTAIRAAVRRLLRDFPGP